jgi:hypothetical protein
MQNSSISKVDIHSSGATEQPANKPTEFNFDGRDLLRLRTALGYLPGVKLRASAEVLSNTQYLLVEEEARRESLHMAQNPEDAELDLSCASVEFYGHQLCSSELEGLVAMSDFGTRCITPKGAQLMIKLYEGGAFERYPGKKGLPGEPAAALYEYAANEAELIAKSQARYRENSEWLTKRDAFLDKPESVPESEFTYSLLNALFFKHLGPGSNEMVVGGLRVEKGVTAYSSNSGKTRDSAVVFRWASPDGQLRERLKESAYSGNRRNDADRNWGLPE